MKMLDLEGIKSPEIRQVLVRSWTKLKAQIRIVLIVSLVLPFLLGVVFVITKLNTDSKINAVGDRVSRMAESGVNASYVEAVSDEIYSVQSDVAINENSISVLQAKSSLLEYRIQQLETQVASTPEVIEVTRVVEVVVTATPVPSEVAIETPIPELTPEPTATPELSFEEGLLSIAGSNEEGWTLLFDAAENRVVGKWYGVLPDTGAECFARAMEYMGVDDSVWLLDPEADGFWTFTRSNLDIFGYSGDWPTIPDFCSSANMIRVDQPDWIMVERSNDQYTVSYSSCDECTSVTFEIHSDPTLCDVYPYGFPQNRSLVQLQGDDGSIVTLGVWDMILVEREWIYTAKEHQYVYLTLDDEDELVWMSPTGEGYPGVYDEIPALHTAPWVDGVSNWWNIYNSPSPYVFAGEIHEQQSPVKYLGVQTAEVQYTDEMTDTLNYVKMQPEDLLIEVWDFEGPGAYLPHRTQSDDGWEMTDRWGRYTKISDSATEAGLTRFTINRDGNVSHITLSEYALVSVRLVPGEEKVDYGGPVYLYSPMTNQFLDRADELFGWPYFVDLTIQQDGSVWIWDPNDYHPFYRQLSVLAKHGNYMLPDGTVVIWENAVGLPLVFVE